MRLLAGWAICLLVLPVSWSVQAQQTRWISDQLPLDMRSGNSNAYRVIKMLEPGTRVSLLKVDSKTQFSQVSMADGTKGWLANRYLMKEPSGREQLAKAKASIARLTTASQPLQNELSTLNQRNETLSLQLEEAISTRARLEQELAHVNEVSSNAVALDSSNQSLMETNQLLQHEIDVLKGENGRLLDDSTREWFLNGVFAVGFGALLAIIIPRIVPRRKSNEWR